MIRRPLLSVLVAAGLGGCAVGPDFERPAAPSSTRYAHDLPQATSAAANPGETTTPTAGQSQRFVDGLDIPAQWWMLFRSPKLDRLVGQALAANPTVEAAKAALRQSRELSSAQWTAFLPSVQGDFQATRTKNATGSISSPISNNDAYYSLYTTQLNLTYAPDVFGATRRAVEGAEAGIEVNRFQLEAVYLTLSSNVVVSAIAEASLRGQIAATERLLSIQHALTDKVRAQIALGTASQLDLLSQQAAEAATAQTLPPLTKQLGQVRDGLTALLGRLPDDQPEETFQLSDLTLPSDLPVSLPSALVEQRPDIRQAEASLHAATAAVGVTVANFLPQISITANTGSTGLHPDQLFSPTFGLWSVGANMTQTIFDAGSLLHKKRAADAAMEQAAAQYRSTVVLAFQNVADSLRALAADADTLKAAAAAEAAARRAFDLARRQYPLGTIPETALLSAEQAWHQAEIALVQAEANRYSDTAGLFQALGGGWWNRQEEASDERGGSAHR